MGAPLDEYDYEADLLTEYLVSYIKKHNNRASIIIHGFTKILEIWEDSFENRVKAQKQEKMYLMIKSIVNYMFQEKVVA